MTNFILKQECFEIVGAAMEVHSELGNGLLEQIYQEALKIEFESRKIPNIREAELKVYYKGNLLGKKYKADFICYNNIIVELKAVEKLLPEHESQLLNYMHICEKRIGLLINFGAESLQWKRMIL